jgi:uncharacterized protein YeaO (DUF488 family)
MELGGSACACSTSVTSGRPAGFRIGGPGKNAEALNFVALFGVLKTRTTMASSVQPKIGIKRAYDKPESGDGLRILIDRLWPRGISKIALKLDAWPRALSPSTELRKWYGHDPALFAEFRRRYRAELAGEKDELAGLRAMIKGHRATLITATRELDLSHAVVLREMLDKN